MIRIGLLILLAVPALTLAAAESLDHGAPAGKPTPFAGTIAQSIAALLVFLIVFWVLKAKAWGPILKGLNDRENKIRHDLLAAEKAHQEAAAMLENYKRQLANADAEVRQRLADAQKDAEALSAQLKMQAQAEIEEMKARAARELEAAKQGALAEIHEHAATLATSVAEKILRRNINETDQRELVQSSLAQLSSMARN
ncbi:MAG: F0F1 ATP synthase subunit B [Phycisphaerales bacterium]|nr:F0F1 ATP synthase subunit B [Phycisphaerales bacterium]